jgi:tripartite-type tricarboxylate transporter receptor subunit TctC
MSDATTWFGVFAPAKPPAELTAKIYEAIRKSMGRRIRTRLSNRG